MAKVTKLKDRQNNEILPVTRGTLVEMNDGTSLQTAYDAINSTHYTKAEINAAGYLQSFTETDPTVPSYVKSITQQDITNWNNKLDTFTETDPSISSYLRAITEQDISNWNNKLDAHQDLSSYVSKTELNNAGYLTSFTETDPTVPSYVKEITETDITNWNSVKPKYIFTFEDNVGPVPTTEDYSSLSTRITNGEIVEGHSIELGFPNSAEDIYYLQSYNFSGGDFITFINGKGTRVLTFADEDTPTVTCIDYITPTQLNNASYVSKSELNAAGYLTSFTESDPIYSASAAAGITSTDITNWNSKTDNVGTITGITMNGASKGTSGVVDLGTVLTSHQSLTSYATSANYDSSAKKIYLKHDTTVLSEIDATDFIKDGMVDTAYVQGSNLVISFNTDAGKSPVSIPVTDIFNASNYYTKTEINNAGYLTSFTETDPIYSASAAAGITSSDITNWNSKTNNVGTITGITMNGSSKGTSGVVNLGTVVTSETDPIYSASAAAGITSTDISNWNSKTDNVGTITGITMNGASKGTSGVVNLGTVITSETQLSKGTATGSGNAVTDISVSNHQITLTKGKTFIETETDPVYSASAAAGITSSDITNWNSKTSNTGTITGITMNGSSKGTSGVVNLGTVITSETQLSKGTTTGSGNAVTDISVSNHQITLTKGSTFLTAHQDIKTINNNTLVGTGNVTINELPSVTSSDNGKVLQVVNGTWTLVSPVTLYSGSGTPNNAQGNNGDLYLQI